MQSHMSTPLQVARRYWGVSLVRGLVAIAFGLVTLLWPHLTFLIFMLAFGIFAIVEGLILLGNAFTQRSARRTATRRTVEATPREREQYPQDREVAEREQYAYGGRAHAQAQPEPRANRAGYISYGATRGTLIIEGILSIICGILALVLPGFIGALALYAVTAWALFKGLGSLAQTGTRGWVLGLIGILGIILFLYMLFNPLGVIRSLLWIVGLFSLIMGVLLVVRAIIHGFSTAREKRPIEPSY